MNSLLKPILKKVEPNFGSSFVLRNFSSRTGSEIPKWHYHPEIEIVFIENGQGKRHIGNNISNFDDGDLIMIGANLPHYGFPTRLAGDLQEIVLQVDESVFGNDFLHLVELEAIKMLTDKAKLGLAFHGEVKMKVGESLKSMFEMNAFERLMELIKIFYQLATSDEYTVLNAEGNSLIASGNDIQKIDIVYTFVRNNFDSPISLQDIASLVSMTIPALCRFFKRSTGKTIVQFINDYRISHACKLICNEYDSISNIAFESGFQNISNFNRVFKRITGMSPSDFRSQRKSVYKPDIKV